MYLFPTELSSVVNKVLPSSLGHYTILLISKDLLPKEEGSSALTGDSSTVVHISQYRHAIIGTVDSGTVKFCCKNIFLVNGMHLRN